MFIFFFFFVKIRLGDKILKIYIGCDHRGVDLKAKIIKYLKENDLDCEDIGLENSTADDYPKFAFKLGEMVRDNKGSLGILICGSGVGMSIAANKVKGVRCVRAVSVDDAFKGKNHNGANVIAIGSEVTTDFNQVKEMIDTFITTKAPCEERHLKRVQAIRMYEDEH